MRGRVQHVGHVKGWNNPVYLRLAKALKAVDPDFQPSTLLELQVPTRVGLLVEGETDAQHLLVAQEKFHAEGAFTNLVLEVNADTVANGDAELWDACKGLARSPQSIPRIAVFDRDNEQMLRKAVGESGFKDYGNRVAAVAIVAPEWLDTDRVCIEMLYPDDVLRIKDEHGRRIYLSGEFHPKSGHHGSEPVHTTHPERRTLVRDDVYALTGGDATVGLSKTAFANLVAACASDLRVEHFDGFRPTFAAIEEAVARIAGQTPTRASQP